MLNHQHREYAGTDQWDRCKPFKRKNIGGIWVKRVISPQFSVNKYMGYFDFVVDKAPRETMAVTGTGRINLDSVSQWVQNNRGGYEPDKKNEDYDEEAQKKFHSKRRRFPEDAHKYTPKYDPY